MGVTDQQEQNYFSTNDDELIHLSRNVLLDLCVDLAPEVKRTTHWICAIIICHSPLTKSSFKIHTS